MLHCHVAPERGCAKRPSRCLAARVRPSIPKVPPLPARRWASCLGCSSDAGSSARAEAQASPKVSSKLGRVAANARLSFAISSCASSIGGFEWAAVTSAPIRRSPRCLEWAQALTAKLQEWALARHLVYRAKYSANRRDLFVSRDRALVLVSGTFWVHSGQRCGMSPNERPPREAAFRLSAAKPLMAT